MSSALDTLTSWGQAVGDTVESGYNSAVETVDDYAVNPAVDAYQSFENTAIDPVEQQLSDWGAEAQETYQEAEDKYVDPVENWFWGDSKKQADQSGGENSGSSSVSLPGSRTGRPRGSVGAPASGGGGGRPGFLGSQFGRRPAIKTSGFSLTNSQALIVGAGLLGILIFSRRKK